MLFNNNNNFKKNDNENDLKNFEKINTYNCEHFCKTSTNSAQYQQQQLNDVEMTPINNPTLSFYTTPMSSTLNESSSNSIFDLKTNCEATIETFQNEFNLENCSNNNNTSFLIEKLQQQFSAITNKDNNNEQVIFFVFEFSIFLILTKIYFKIYVFYILLNNSGFTEDLKTLIKKTLKKIVLHNKNFL